MLSSKNFVARISLTVVSVSLFLRSSLRVSISNWIFLGKFDFVLLLRPSCFVRNINFFLFFVLLPIEIESVIDPRLNAFRRYVGSSRKLERSLYWPASLLLLRKLFLGQGEAYRIIWVFEPFSVERVLFVFWTNIPALVHRVIQKQEENFTVVFLQLYWSEFGLEMVIVSCWSLILVQQGQQLPHFLTEFINFG